MAFVYSIDGFSLADPQGRWWVTAEGSSHSPAVAVRSVSNRVPGMNGIPRGGWETREEAVLTLRVMTRSRDAATRETYWEAVKSLVVAKSEFTLGRAVEGIERTTLAKLRSISEPELSARTGTLVGVISMTILDGLFHGSTTDTVIPFNANFTNTIVTGLTGTAGCDDWTLRVRGPIASFSVTDEVTKTGLSFTGALLSTEYLFVTGVSARKSTSSGAWELGGADVSGGIAKLPTGLLSITPRPIGLDPLSRVSTLAGTRVESGVTTEIRVRARPAYA